MMIPCPVAGWALVAGFVVAVGVGIVAADAEPAVTPTTTAASATPRRSVLNMGAFRVVDITHR
jgi:hypothetical protein